MEWGFLNLFEAGKSRDWFSLKPRIKFSLTLIVGIQFFFSFSSSPMYSKLVFVSIKRSEQQPNQSSLFSFANLFITFVHFHLLLQSFTVIDWDNWNRNHIRSRQITVVLLRLASWNFYKIYTKTLTLSKHNDQLTFLTLNLELIRSFAVFTSRTIYFLLVEALKAITKSSGYLLMFLFSLREVDLTLRRWNS